MYINKWYIYLLDIIIVGFCIYRSVVCIKLAKKNHGYTLYSNALAVNSLWYDTTVDISKVYKVVPKKTLLDKMTKRTNSLEIYFKDGGYYKIKLYHISEDIGELISEIMQRSLEARAENQP